jgi:hypothetical protein
MDNPSELTYQFDGPFGDKMRFARSGQLHFYATHPIL